MSMEENYLGYTIKYNEDRERFEATNGKHSFENAQLKELRRKLERQAAHDRGFKQFEAWYFTGHTIRRVRVTSVNSEEPRFDGYHPDRKPVYRVRISYLDKAEDEYGQRTDTEHTHIFALDAKTEDEVLKIKNMIEQRDAMTKAIETMAERLPRLKLSDIGIAEQKEK